MSTSIRIFIINDDDRVESLPVARYEKLLRRDVGIKISKYAGRRIRYASVVVELADRKPINVLYAQYSYLAFDAEGRLDINEREKKATSALDMLPPLYQNIDKHMIDARHKFARKRYEDTYKWQPSPEILADIESAIFGK
jgi:hypothetical protein